MKRKFGDWLAGIFFWFIAILAWPCLKYGKNKKIVFGIFIIEFLLMAFLAVGIVQALSWLLHSR